MIVDMDDVREVLSHYWREYPRPKEVRDVINDICADLEQLAREEED